MKIIIFWQVFFTVLSTLIIMLLRMDSFEGYDHSFLTTEPMDVLTFMGACAGVAFSIMVGPRGSGWCSFFASGGAIAAGIWIASLFAMPGAHPFFAMFILLVVGFFTNGIFGDSEDGPMLLIGSIPYCIIGAVVGLTMYVSTMWLPIVLYLAAYTFIIWMSIRFERSQARTTAS